MSIDDKDLNEGEGLVLDATDPLARAQGALRIIQRFAEHADRIDSDPMSHVDGRYNRLAAEPVNLCETRQTENC